MDDTFSFVATTMPRRRVDPFALRLAAAATVFVAAVGALGAFVVQHERLADARVQADARTSVEAARAQAVAGAEGASGSTQGVEAGLDPAVAAADAQATLEETLALTWEALARGASFADAGPAQLAALTTEPLFVDGPSTNPLIVSVATSETAWAAAVLSLSGDCFWLRVTESGRIDRGTSATCTGHAALVAAPAGW